ncbi:MAG: hypothetical protein ETSY1_03825 [Candidatus Entotheonella factor]|uniref:Histidine-specific methyltransferase SAM-dependent domain-containing protein n=2 Tax=Candidatus Entotheonella TaxID=93171 RepID=W4LW92_ENTF1|nr:MAG: hypothetical protein ETSY1_03825 [Candidatus Entotheonella factor]
MPITLTFHDSQYPARVAEQLRQGLRSRRLPAKFLYDSPAQAQRWLAYHQAYSPSRTESDLLGLYQDAYVAALARLPNTPLHYVSLGCGGGRKDALFLQRAWSQLPQLHYTPTDISAALVVETMLHIQAAFAELTCSPYVLDLEAEPELNAMLAAHDPEASVRLFSCFGMIPNFDYQTFLPYVQRTLREDDLLLISANLSPDPYPAAKAYIAPQYDNPHAHAWYSGLLDSLGFPMSQVSTSVQAVPLREDGQIWQLQVHTTFLQPVTLTVYDESFHFGPDEHLQVFFSTRFTPEVIPEIFAEAGLQVIESFLFESREEGIYLCGVSA